MFKRLTLDVRILVNFCAKSTINNPRDGLAAFGYAEMALDHAGQSQVVVESLGGKDLAGAMLRRSFSRRPNKSLYWPPLPAVAVAFITAGLWPGGLLIYRLWKYATHQRFRAGELALWVRKPNPPVIQSMSAGSPVHDVHWTEIMPRFAIRMSMLCWLVAVAIGGVIALNLLLDFQFLQSRSGSTRMMVIWFVLISLACMLHISAVFGLRERVESCFCRRDMRLALLRASRTRNMPLWCLWPAVLALFSIPVKLAGFQFAAMWIVTATAAVLASEIQRGYITVADRRLRLSVARAIGAAMYSEARR